MNLLPYTAGRVFNAPLMISRSKLDTILNVITPRMQGEALSFSAPSEEREYIDSREGIAVIPVVGTLVRRTVALEAYSGLTSYAAIEEQLDAALNDNSIKGILLDIDSPGGESGGVFDLADKIQASRKIKPIWAVVNEDAFSAAYVLAAAAETIYIPRTGGAGSIGVIAMHLDESKAEDDAGLTYTAIFAGARKNDLSPHEPLSDPARKQLQAEVNRVYKILTGTISRLRGIDQEKIENTEAALYFGENALTVGLADKIGTFNDALTALALHAKNPTAVADSTTTTENRKGDTMMTARAEEHDDDKDKEKDAKASKRRTEAEDRDDEDENEDKEKEKPASRRRAKAEDKDDDEEDNSLEAEDDEEDEEEEAPANARRRGRAKRASALRKDALAYMAEVNELCLLAGRPDRAAAFISKAVPLAVVRKSLLNAKAAQDDASMIMGHAPYGMTRESDEPKIDTAAIYAQRNKKP